MDWKSYYSDELKSPASQEFMHRCFARYPQGDRKIAQILEGGGVISFPHTSIYYAGDDIARAVATLYQIGVERIIALGVLHGGTLPERYRGLYDEFLELTSSKEADDGRIRDLFRAFKGAFIKRSPIETPFGRVPLYRPKELKDDVVRENGGLLANEFSLNTLFSLLAFYAREGDLEPIPVLPLFIGLTRGPGGSFTVASQIAERLREAIDGKMALVATGDLVHYGTAYSSPQEMGGKPTGSAELEAFFAERVRSALERACSGDYEAFYRASTEELKNDQRQIVPIICEYLGEGAASYELLQFELSDYSQILEVEPPCVVASALVGFTKKG